MDNILLKKLNNMPGQTFRLPSRGLPYKNGELRPEVIDGEVVVFPMTTLDEIYLKTPDMLFQGTAVRKVIENRVPQVLKAEKLLAKDVDYLLTCLRKVSYGDALTIDYTCDTCESPKTSSYNININSFLNNSKEFNSSDEVFTKEIDNFVFKFKFVVFEDIIKINQQKFNDTPEDTYKALIESLIVNIDSIDDVTNPEVIKEFLENSNVQFQNKIFQAISDLNNWGVEYIAEIECKYCKQHKKIPISLNPVNFFTLPSNQTTL